MKIAICDDERTIQNSIAHKILERYPDSELQYFSSGKELLEKDWEADLLFLDIQMPELNGMEAAKELRRQGRKPILIFITVLKDYVFQAFDVGAFHYLLKPYEEEKFYEVLEAAVQQYQERQSIIRAKEKCILIQHLGYHRRIRLSAIIYAEIYNRKVVLHVRKDGFRGNKEETEKIVYYGKLSDLEAEVGEDFFRSHRSYLIHFKYVEKYDASTIYMEYGGCAMMAKKNYPEFVKRFLRYNKCVFQNRRNDDQRERT